jgi:hypothetical protein
MILRQFAFSDSAIEHRSTFDQDECKTGRANVDANVPHRVRQLCSIPSWWLRMVNFYGESAHPSSMVGLQPRIGGRRFGLFANVEADRRIGHAEYRYSTEFVWAGFPRYQLSALKRTFLIHANLRSIWARLLPFDNFNCS